MDFCIRPGYKTVQAKKAWNGRYGFVSDYVANPKGVATKYQSYSVSIGFTESYSTKNTCYDYEGHFYGTTNASGNNNGSAFSGNTLSQGGLVLCDGAAHAGDGTVQTDAVSYTHLTLPTILRV